jgi:hypothetical protein
MTIVLLVLAYTFATPNELLLDHIEQALLQFDANEVSELQEEITRTIAGEL